MLGRAQTLARDSRVGTQLQSVKYEARARARPKRRQREHIEIKQ